MKNKSNARTIRQTMRGFTLIEMMVVVAIIGILAAIAYPSYRDSVRKGHRAEAAVALVEAAQSLERYYSTNGRYTTANPGSTLPANVFASQVPATGAARYTIAATGTPSANTYTLRATRAGTMASDPCGDFEINHAGVKTLNGKSSAYSVEQCWRQ